MAAAVQLDQTRLAAARLRASGMQPYLAIALYAMTPAASEGLGTFAVDERGRLLIDPAKLAEWPVSQVAGVLLHEVGHVLRDHASRARSIGATGALERRVWNVAGDAEINDDLLEAGVELPASPVTPQALELPAHRAAEFYYAALAERGYLPEDELDCGPASDGTPWGGPERPLPPGLPQLLPPGLAPHEVVLLRQKVAAEIARRGSVSPGSVPGGWQRWAHATLHPQLDWRRLLAARVRSCTAAVSGATDYSYSWPPRRRVPGVVLPAMRRPLPRVAVIVDTSGSVSADLLSLAWTEVHGCLRHLSVRRDLLAVYAADVAVRRLPGLPRRMATLTGGGGTDMAAAIGVAVAARPAPDLVIVITDGLTPWPATRPGRDVVVALLPLPDRDVTAGLTAKARHQVPAWAHVVEVRPLWRRKQGNISAVAGGELAGRTEGECSGWIGQPERQRDRVSRHRVEEGDSAVRITGGDDGRGMAGDRYRRDRRGLVAAYLVPPCRVVQRPPAQVPVTVGRDKYRARLGLGQAANAVQEVLAFGRLPSRRSQRRRAPSWLPLTSPPALNSTLRSPTGAVARKEMRSARSASGRPAAWPSPSASRGTPETSRPSATGPVCHRASARSTPRY